MKKKRKKLLLGLDKMLAHDLTKQFILLGMLMVVLLALSYVMLAFSGCQWLAFCRQHHLRAWLLPIYLLIDANALSNL